MALIDSPPIPLVLCLLVAGYLLNTAAVLYVYAEPKNRRKAFLGLATAIPAALVLGGARGNSVPTALLLAADVLLVLPVLFLMLRKGIARFEQAGSPYVAPRDRSPEERRQGAWAAAAVTGVGAVLLLLESLPIWPF
ncbi:hypothetical protein ACIQF6_21055 [Kitasatospora sp. NPDC092948]|uniref:hypothetical protein n=1 Tax=Kitasatospora sp. NPDC092948 TaxID=3364088 RepID=UPI00382D73B0